MLYLPLSHLKNLPGEKQTSLKMFWGYIPCVQLVLPLFSEHMFYVENQNLESNTSLLLFSVVL